MASDDERSVIFEMIAVGRYVKVSAVDTRTGVEVSIVGDPRRGERALRQAAAAQAALRDAAGRRSGKTGSGRRRTYPAAVVRILRQAQDEAKPIANTQPHPEPVEGGGCVRDVCQRPST